MARRDHLLFYTDLLVESKQGLTCVVIYMYTHKCHIYYILFLFLMERNVLVTFIWHIPKSSRLLASETVPFAPLLPTHSAFMCCTQIVIY